MNSRSWSWTMQFALGNRIATVTIPPFVLLLMLVTTGLGYGVGNLHLGRRVELQNQEIANLREHNAGLRLDIYKKRAELERVAALADARSQELWNELQARQSELSQLWQQLAPVAPKRRPRLASRSGRLRRPGVHGRFLDLQEHIAANRVEMDDARVATQAYQAAQLRLERELRFRCTPAGPPCCGEMTSPFGLRMHPIYGIGRPHLGVDYTTEYGSQIRATGEGVVVTSDWMGGYGQAVEIDHGYGLKTLYAHCSELNVKKGQKVRRGQVIGRVGMTGLASGPHCHYEVHREGKPIDPASYLVTIQEPKHPAWLQLVLGGTASPQIRYH